MEQPHDATARSLLKTTGVLMLIFGIFGTVLYLLGLAAILILRYATSGVFSAAKDLIGMSLLLVSAIVELICGILGIRAAKKLERLSRSMTVWGCICLLLTLISIGHIALRDSTLQWWLLPLGVLLSAVVPIVYLVAIQRLRRFPAADADVQP